MSPDISAAALTVRAVQDDVRGRTGRWAAAEVCISIRLRAPPQRDRFLMHACR